MRVFHGYCITRSGSGAPPPGLLGIDGQPVRLLAEGGVVLWFSEIENAPPTIERLQAHDRVVRMAMRESTPLPLRFGAGVSQEDAAREGLRQRGTEFIERLDWIGDRVEMSLRVGVPAPPEGGDAISHRSLHEQRAPAEGSGAGPGAGRRFLEERRRTMEAALAAERESELLLTSLAAEFAIGELPTITSVIAHAQFFGTVAHLVHRDGVAAYRKRVEALKLSRSELRIEISGPWAPYSFVR